LSLLRVALEESCPLERPELGPNAHLLKVVEHGLGFLPLTPSATIFLLVERRRDRPAAQAFLAVLADPAVRARM
jgi:hypothetical protein